MPALPPASSPVPVASMVPSAAHGRLAQRASRVGGWFGRPRSVRTVVCVLSAYLLLAANWPLWVELARLGRTSGNTWPSIAGMAWLVFTGTMGLLALTAWSRWIKPLWMLIVVMAAVVQYYMFAYRMVMDPSMAANVFQTDVAEARDLLSLPMLLSTLAVSVPALLWLWHVRITPETWRRRAARNAVLLLAALAATAAGGVAMSRTLAPLMRSHVQLRYMMNPLASAWSAGTVALRPMLQHGRERLSITAGAALGPSHAMQARPPMLMLVVGETARADRFALNGYARDTTPELAARQVLSWRHVRSCGTHTLASVPCMFSHLGKSDYDSRRNDYDNLLDVLQAAGLAVLWLDNQGGCKGVCDRVPHAQVNDAAGVAAHPALCSGDECLDEVLLQDLDRRLAALPPERTARGVVLVLHQMGSHGPAYYKRAPPAYKRFAPECRSSTLSECTQAELMNAYDNSIAYTDHVLASAIDWLKTQSGRYDAGLLYMSDHGESLGEYGLYLHGMPYALAPEVQKHVPFVAWLDGGLGRRLGLGNDCLRAGIDAELTHDNLYPTVLGLLDVRTPTYRPAWDAFAHCHAPAES